MKTVDKTRLTKALLKVGYTCNNNCLFCHSAPHRGIDSSTHELLAKIRATERAGVDMLVLSGGEPTIRPDLDQIVREIKRSSMALGLVTNGRMLAVKPVRDLLLNNGLEYVYVSIAGGTSETHDRLVGTPGAFHQTLQGLLALAAEARGAAGRSGDRGLELTLNCVVTRPVISELDRVADVALELAELSDGNPAPLRLKYSAVEPEGRALTNFKTLVPRLSESATAVARTILQRQAEAARANLILSTDGFPPCLLQSLDQPECVQSDLWTDGFLFMSEAMERDWHPVDDRHKTRPRPCRACSEDGCPGVFKTYVKRKGSRELKPVVRPRPNSFDFTALVQVAGSRDVRCPVLDNLTRQPDRRRELLTRDGDGDRDRDRDRDEDGWTLWHTSTTDFSEAQLDLIKNRMEQVYLDPGGGRRPTGLPAGSKKLRLAAVCRRCERRPACGGLFVPNRPQPLARDMKLMDEHLERIVTRYGGKGGTCRILDMEIGASSNIRPLRKAIDGGRAEYWGLDPAGPSARRKHEESERFHFVRSTAEQFTWGGPKFDAALSIGNWAHFRDLEQAISRTLHPLSTRGLVYVVSEIPFGLLRTGADAHADGGRGKETAVPERYRNHLMADTMEWLDSYRLELGFRRDAGPDTSNKYFLVYRKPK